MLYAFVLFLHSNLRWLVLLSGVVLAVSSLVAWRKGRGWEKSDNWLHIAYVSAFDTAMLFGLWLYIFLSPFPRLLFSDPASGMRDPMLRFFGIEHATLMVLAGVLVHVGRVMSKRAKDGAARHRWVWSSVLASLLVILIAIPWPGSATRGRPLLRGLPTASAPTPTPTPTPTPSPAPGSDPDPAPAPEGEGAASAVEGAGA